MLLPLVESVNKPSIVGVSANQIDPESDPIVDDGSFGSTPAEELLVFVVWLFPVLTIGEQKLSPATMFAQDKICDQFNLIVPRAELQEWTRR